MFRGGGLWKGGGEKKWEVKKSRLNGGDEKISPH